MKRMLWSVFVAMASFGAVVRAHGATNNVVGFNFTVQHAAASPLTNEVVFSRDGKVVFGYDLDAKQTNWIYQPLGSPDLLAFSSDGAYLFIGLPGSNGVLQVEAPTRTPVRLIRTGRVFRIVPVPGEPESILTSTASDGTFGALAVWDAGVRRTFTNGASGGTIYGGKVYYRTAQNVIAAALGPQGLTVERSAAAFSSFPGHLTVTEKYVIESPGYVRDRATLSVIGRLPIALESSELTIPYEESDCLLIAQATTNYVVQSYRLSNLQFTGSFLISSATPLFDYPTEFLKIAPNRALMIFKRPILVEPMAIAATRADLGMTFTESAEPALVGTDRTVIITVTNRGPANATGVVLTNIAGGLRRLASVGDIAVGGAAEVTLTSRAYLPWISDTVFVNANEADPDVTDNLISILTRVTDGVEEAKGRDQYLQINDLAIGGASKKLYATTGAGAGKLGNAILRIDPLTGLIERTNVLGIPLNQLALSEDEQFAYVSATSISNFARVNLASGAVEWAPTVGTVQDIQTAPGDGKLVVATQAGVYVYDDLTRLPHYRTQTGKVGLGVGNAFVGSTLYQIDGTGLVAERAYFGFSDVSSMFGIYDRRLFGSNGQVFDLDSEENLREGVMAGAMSIGRREHKVFYAPNTGSILRVADADTLTEVGQVAWAGLVSPSAFVTGNGFAAASSQGRLMILESSAFSDQGVEDLSLKFERLHAAFVTNEVSYRVIVQNSLAETASNVVVTIALSTNILPLRFEIAGLVTTNGFTISSRLPELAGGGSITGIVTGLPLRAGIFRTTASAAGMRRDATPEDNTVSLMTPVQILPATDSRIELEGEFGTLARNPRTGKFISCPPRLHPSKGPVEIDAMTAEITPLDMALPHCVSMSISDDGLTLYGVTDDVRTVILFNLENREEIGRITLEDAASKVLAVPGTAQTFVVGMASKTVIYDGTMARPTAAPGFFDIAVSEDGNKVYGAAEACARYSLVASGLDEDATTFVHRTAGGQVKIQTQDGLVFTSHGQIVDVSKNKLIADLFEGLFWLGPTVPDLRAGKIYRIYTGVEIIDAQTHRQLAYYDLLDRVRNAVDLFRFGGNGLLVYSEEGLVLIRTSLIGTGADADVGISIQQTSVTKDRVEYDIELRNESSVNSANAQAHLVLPAGVEIVAAPDGSAQKTNGVFMRPRTLAPGERFTERVAIKPIATPFIARAEAITDARDAVTWNNWDATLTAATFLYVLEETKSLPIAATEMTALPNGNLCLITGPMAGPGLEDRLITIDPMTGRIVGAKPFLGFRPNKLAVTDVGTYAFASVWPAGSIYRINLLSNAIEQTAEIVGGRYVFDMTAPPGPGNAKRLLATTIPYGPPTSSDQRLYFLNDGNTVSYTDGILYLSSGGGLAGSGSAGVWWLGSDGSLLLKIGDLGGYADLIADTGGHVFAENGTEYQPYRAIPVGPMAFDPVWNDRVYVLGRDDIYFTIHAFRRDDFSQFDLGAGGPLEYPYTFGNLVRFAMGGLAFTTDTQINLIRSAIVPIAMGVDTDGDGLDDAYEWKYGLDPVVADADKDLDGDGYSNRDEFLAGTAPNDPESVFKIQLRHIDGTLFQFTFSFVQERRYQVLRRERLDAGAWEILQDDFSPMTGFPVVDIGAGSAYYTVKVLP